MLKIAKLSSKPGLMKTAKAFMCAESITSGWINTLAMFTKKLTMEMSLEILSPLLLIRMRLGLGMTKSSWKTAIHGRDAQMQWD